jgi:hypothetical protein
MTGTSPDASVSDTSVWQLAFFSTHLRNQIMYAPLVVALAGSPLLDIGGA